MAAAFARRSNYPSTTEEEHYWSRPYYCKPSRKITYRRETCILCFYKRDQQSIIFYHFFPRLLSFGRPTAKACPRRGQRKHASDTTHNPANTKAQRDQHRKHLRRLREAQSHQSGDEVVSGYCERGDVSNSEQLRPESNKHSRTKYFWDKWERTGRIMLG